MKNKFNYLKKQVFAIFSQNKFLLKPFLIIFLIYLLGLSAMLLAGVHYADDIARTTQGYTGWTVFSRYINIILSRGMHTDGYLTNIAPLPQLIAILIISIASLMLICIVSGKEIFRKRWQKWIWRIIAVIPLGLCPYMLECFSYQYDSIYMALSVLFAIFPFLFQEKSTFLYCFLIVISILGICMTYQASIGIYLVIMIFIIVKKWNEKEKTKTIIKFVMSSMITSILATLFFQKVLMIPVDGYVSNTIPGMNNLFPLFFEHLIQYFELIINDFRMLWLVLIGGIVLLFIIVFIVKSKRNKTAAMLVSVGSVFLMLIAAYALYAILEKPLFAARAMYTLGAFIAIISIYITMFLPKKLWVKFLQISPILLLAWCFFVFSFTYGNALKEQDSFRNNQVNMVMSDLNKLLINRKQEEIIVQVEGQIGWSPILKNMPRDEYRMLYRLLDPSFSKSTPWMAYQITNGSGISGLIEKTEVKLLEQDMEVLENTMLYNIYENEVGILIKFKGDDLD